MKIISTNWINILGVFIAVLIFSTVRNLVDTEISRTVFQAFFATLILICLYGLLFWLSFAVCLILLDLILIVKNQGGLRSRIFIEWFIISTPFIYWAVIYERQRWLFLVAVFAFLITQMMREKLIRKVIQ